MTPGDDAKGTTLEKRSPIRILLADHQALFRQGLRTLLAPERDCEVIGEAEDFESLLAALSPTISVANGDTSPGMPEGHVPEVTVPDVITIGDNLPGLNVYQNLDTLRKVTGAQILVMSCSADFTPVLAHGWQPVSIRRSEATSLLVPVLRQLVRQTGTVSLQNLAATVARLRAANIAPVPVSNGPALTARENEILQLLATGNTVKDAASELDLSVKTVEAHKFNLMRKLNIHTRTELVCYAQRVGITRPVPA